jgi:serum/glucocorticoid-regulated kinase 2
VAVKTVKKKDMKPIEVFQQRREIEVLKMCQHPNVIKLIDIFENSDYYYIVLEYMAGKDLFDYIQKRGFSLSEQRVKELTFQIGQAIKYLHSYGIVHRDLKLENILLDQNGYLKIIDFGLAKMLQDGEMAASFCGTPEYLAPEMIAQKGHDKSVDWWALGVLIYEMLIGVTPFFNKNRELLLTKIQKSKVVFPDRNKYKIKYSDEIADLITKLLDRDTTKRLGSKDDFTEVLSHPVFKDINIEELE